MDKKIFEQFVGKQVEVFIEPEIPHTSGTVISCDDEHLVLGDEVWSYSAIMGMRALKKNNARHQRQRLIRVEEPQEIEEEEQAQEESEISNLKEENKTEPEPAPAPEPAEKKAESAPDTKTETKAVTAKTPRVLPEDLKGREFEGVVAVFYPEKKWGFIESEEVKKSGVLLNDGERIFVHLNQVSDEALRYKLSTLKLEDKNARPDIKVIFKLGTNNHGAVADDVREKGNVAPKLPDEVLKVDMVSAIYEEGEIEYFRRYEAIPHGQIRVKGNKLYRFEEEDVIDPVLAVFLECSPSAEGQKVKFIKKTGKRGNETATQVSAAVPFPEEKLKDWERSGLIQKAKERMGIKD